MPCHRSRYATETEIRTAAKITLVTVGPALQELARLDQATE